MLTTAELASIRAVQAAALPDRCSILRIGTASDGMGGFTSTWAAVASEVPCRLSSMVQRPSENVAATALQSTVLYMLTLPALTDIRPTDRVIVGATTFEVAGVLSPGGAMETARRIQLVRVG